MKMLNISQQVKEGEQKRKLNERQEIENVTYTNPTCVIHNTTPHGDNEATHHLCALCSRSPTFFSLIIIYTGKYTKILVQLRMKVFFLLMIWIQYVHIIFYFLFCQFVLKNNWKRR